MFILIYLLDMFATFAQSNRYNIATVCPWGEVKEQEIAGHLENSFAAIPHCISHSNLPNVCSTLPSRKETFLWHSFASPHLFNYPPQPLGSEVWLLKALFFSVLLPFYLFYIILVNLGHQLFITNISLKKNLLISQSGAVLFFFQENLRLF